MRDIYHFEQRISYKETFGMDLSACESNCGLVFANFNQDFGCFVAVSTKGFSIFNSDPLRLKEERHFTRDASGHLALSADCENPESYVLDSTLEAVLEGKARILKVSGQQACVNFSIYAVCLQMRTYVPMVPGVDEKPLHILCSVVLGRLIISHIPV